MYVTYHSHNGISETMTLLLRSISGIQRYQQHIYIFIFETFETFHKNLLFE